MEITDINQLDVDKSYTYADYLLWKFKERVELIQGRILKMSPAPGTRHQIISRNLTLELGNKLKYNNCQLFTAPFDVRLPRKGNKDAEITTVVQPDLCVICHPEKLDERGCNGAPDLIIEILSPGNSKRELKTKFNLYEEAGVAEYWVINPSEETVLVNVLADGKYKTLRPVVDDYIISEIFPNTRIMTTELFK